MQNCGMAPPVVTWAEGLSAQTVGEALCFWSSPDFGPKSGLNLGEDLFLFFIFWFSSNFGPKSD